MHFVRFFGSGYNTTSSDPRNKVFAEYKCSVCGEEQEIEVTKTWKTTFQTIDKICPHCKCFSIDDKEKSLNEQLEKLTSEKSRIEIEIDKIERELNELQNKEIKIEKE
jgi:hypothetical protein